MLRSLAYGTYRLVRKFLKNWPNILPDLFQLFEVETCLRVHIFFKKRFQKFAIGVHNFFIFQNQNKALIEELKSLKELYTGKGYETSHVSCF